MRLAFLPAADKHSETRTAKAKYVRLTSLTCGLIVGSVAHVFNVWTWHVENVPHSSVSLERLMYARCFYLRTRLRFQLLPRKGLLCRDS